MEPSKVDLLTRFGRITILEHDVFTTSTDCTAFLKAYAFNENKTIEQRVSSGHRKVWSCKSSTCRWEVCISNRGKSTRKNTKTSFCPPGAWFVKSCNLQYSPNCDSIGKCSRQILMELPGFKSAIVPGLSTARKRVAASLRTVDHVNVDHRSAMLYKAIAETKRIMADVDDNYDKLPAFLNSFERQNLGSRVCLQLDTKRKFLRVFLSVGSVVCGQDNWVPLLECDGTHMKHSNYNGVCLLLVRKDGNWANIPVAIAFVHKENADNFEWFFGNCVAAGIKLHDRALFSDRGKQREAQVRLQNRGISVNLKFCAMHIFFNVCSHFRAVEPSIESIMSDLYGLQRTTTLAEYNHILSVIGESFPTPRTLKSGGITQAQTVEEYLQSIHPRSWTMFGNCILTPEEEAVVAQDWNGVQPYGNSCALFFGRTTSAVESQNHALLMAGIRDCQVFDALVLYCKMVVDVLTEKKKNARSWVTEDHTVTPRAMKMFDKQLWYDAACTVRKSNENVFYVDDTRQFVPENDMEEDPVSFTVNKQQAFKGPTTFAVNLTSGACDRCADRHHLRLPCRHTIAAIFNQNANHTSTRGAFRFFHHSYTVAACRNAFQEVSLVLPFV